MRKEIEMIESSGTLVQDKGIQAELDNAGSSQLK